MPPTTPDRISGLLAYLSRPDEKATPCRVKYSQVGRPWFRLNNQFMDIKKNRCFSGPPTHCGYCAEDLPSAKKLFFWYAMARTFLQCPYPMWADADDMWEPELSRNVEELLFQTAFAIGFAENECVETKFPANNPIPGVPELTASNPLTPLNRFSFWSLTLAPYCQFMVDPKAKELVDSVNEVYREWGGRFRKQRELPLSQQPYCLNGDGVTIEAGLPQIRAYANETADAELVRRLNDMHQLLKIVKSQFYGLLLGDRVNYFGTRKKGVASAATLSPGMAKKPSGRS